MIYSSPKKLFSVCKLFLICKLLLASSFMFASISLAIGDIVAVQKVYGPVTNIVRIDDDNKIVKLTRHDRWRELDLDVSARGDSVFISNMRSDSKVDLYKKTDSYKPYILFSGDRLGRPLIASEGSITSPKFSPDGKLIAYLELYRQKPNKDKKSEVLLKVISVDAIRGKLPVKKNKLLAKKNRAATVFKGERIFGFSWHGQHSLLVAHTLTNVSKLELVSLVGLAAHEDSAKSKSRSKKQRLENGEGENKNKLASQTRTLLESSNYAIVFVSSSPNQKHIAYIKNPAKKGDRSLWVYNVKSERHRQISLNGTHVQDSVSWSSEDDEVIFSALKDYSYTYDKLSHKKIYSGGMQLFLASMDKGTRQLTDGNHRHQNPIFSPDGKSIAFLYANVMDARNFYLKVVNKAGEKEETLMDDVAKHSKIFWYD